VDRVCIVLPILAGKTEEARAFQRELDGERKADYARSERAIGITKEHWFLAPLPTGDQLVVYMESPDFGAALQQFSASKDEFDLWFKRRLESVTGTDLNRIPPGMALPELLSSYEA